MDSKWLSHLPKMTLTNVAEADQMHVCLRTKSGPWLPPSSLSAILFCNGGLGNVPAWRECATAKRKRRRTEVGMTNEEEVHFEPLKLWEPYFWQQKKCCEVLSQNILHLGQTDEPALREASVPALWKGREETAILQVLSETQPLGFTISGPSFWHTHFTPCQCFRKVPNSRGLLKGKFQMNLSHLAQADLPATGNSGLS